MARRSIPEALAPYMGIISTEKCTWDLCGRQGVMSYMDEWLCHHHRELAESVYTSHTPIWRDGQLPRLIES